jgi:SMC interacting uncharacterized protein involved in chromosome segregation
MDGLSEKLDDSKLEADKLKNQVSQLEQENDAISSEKKVTYCFISLNNVVLEHKMDIIDQNKSSNQKIHEKDKEIGKLVEEIKLLERKVEEQNQKLKHSIDYLAPYGRMCQMEENEAIKELESTALSYELVEKHLKMDR